MRQDRRSPSICYHFAQTLSTAGRQCMPTVVVTVSKFRKYCNVEVPPTTWLNTITSSSNTQVDIVHRTIYYLIIKIYTYLYLIVNRKINNNWYLSIISRYYHRIYRSITTIQQYVLYNLQNTNIYILNNWFPNV